MSAMEPAWAVRSVSVAEMVSGAAWLSAKSSCSSPSMPRSRPNTAPQRPGEFAAPPEGDRDDGKPALVPTGPLEARSDLSLDPETIDLKEVKASEAPQLDGAFAPDSGDSHRGHSQPAQCGRRRGRSHPGPLLRAQAHGGEANNVVR